MLMRLLPAVLALVVVTAAACSGGDSTPTPEPVDPNTLTDPQEALDAAQVLWASEGGDNYDMTFNWQCFCVVDYVARVDLEVRDNAVAAGSLTDDGDSLSAERLAEYQTVEELFDFIQDAIDRDAAEVRTVYADDGYPTEVWIDYELQLADEERGFFIHALTVS